MIKNFPPSTSSFPPPFWYVIYILYINLFFIIFSCIFLTMSKWYLIILSSLIDHPNSSHSGLSSSKSILYFNINCLKAKFWLSSQISSVTKDSQILIKLTMNIALSQAILTLKKNISGYVGSQEYMGPYRNNHQRE